WSAPRCRESWMRGVPLAVEAPPPLDADNLEDLLGGAMEDVAAVAPARAPALQRLAGAWDAGAIGPGALLPRREGIGDGGVQAAGEDAGYVVSGCRACGAYLKELDRRERWNGGPPLLEDWASPHLDLVARREGLRKPLPALLDLAQTG